MVRLVVALIALVAMFGMAVQNVTPAMAAQEVAPTSAKLPSGKMLHHHESMGTSSHAKMAMVNADDACCDDMQHDDKPCPDMSHCLASPGQALLLSQTLPKPRDTPARALPLRAPSAAALIGLSQRPIDEPPIQSA